MPRAARPQITNFRLPWLCVRAPPSNATALIPEESGGAASASFNRTIESPADGAAAFPASNALAADPERWVAHARLLDDFEAADWPVTVIDGKHLA
jgi:hypothetical protein